MHGQPHIRSILQFIHTKDKGQFHPTIFHEEPEEYQLYNFSFTLSLTAALDTGGKLTSLPGQFTPGDDHVVLV